MCADNNGAVVMVPNNLINIFQPVDITVNTPAKCFISEKYNKWFAEHVANHLDEEKNPDVEVTLKLQK